jgi:hypothetical protein
MDYIDQVTKFITGKIPKEHLIGLIQDKNYIYFKKVKNRKGKFDDKLSVFHEIGRYLTATRRDRKNINLGSPRKIDNLNDFDIMKEILSREFLRILFYDWAEKNLVSDELEYMKYLCFDYFKEEEEKFHLRNKKKGISYPHITQIDQSLEFHLSEVGLSFRDTVKFINSL